MSRNTEYQFVPTDPEEIEAYLIALYETITEETVHPSSPERLFIQFVTGVIVQERVLNNYTGNQNIPSRAEGENLDALAELTFSQGRPEAKAATCTMRFYISEPQKSAVLIPAGTRISDASKTLIWVTPEDGYVPIGETYTDVKHVTCQTPGTVGNRYAVGQINKIVDIYDYYSGCENITVSDGGADVPTDDEYYELMRMSMDAYSTAGARGSYIYWAKQVSTEIMDVAANSPIPGVVKIYVLMKDGTIAEEEIKGKVLEACSADTVRPLTDLVYVEDAEVVPYDLKLTYYIPQQITRSGAEIAAAVQNAVDDYVTWQCGKLGRDINPSRLTRMIMETGIKRVEISSPDFRHLRDGNPKLSVGLSYDITEMIPQIAQLNSIQIINGGYEDE